MDLSGKKIIAWGAGNAFMNAIADFPVGIDYVADDYLAGRKIGNHRICATGRVLSEEKQDVYVVIFTYSSDVYQKIAHRLTSAGFLSGEHFGDYSMLLKHQFAKTMAEQCGVDLKDDWFRVISSLFATMPVKNHSSILGTWLMWGLLSKTRSLSGSAVELGVYEGGAAYYAAVFMSLQADMRSYFLVDSYEGFGELSLYDPPEMKDRFRDNSVKDVTNRFAHFPNFKVVQGLVPDILNRFDAKAYSFVYYDCDLYMPALESLRHFYPKLSDGGVFLIDDYCVQKDFLGVRKAVDEFCCVHGIVPVEIPETSHAVLIK